MDLPEADAARTQPAADGRPRPCPRCGGATWWDGWRRTFPVLDGGRVETRLHRAQCKRGCPSFVESRPDGLYPHRQYQPDVVARVVAAVALGNETPRQAASGVTASATSARRWSRWVAALVEVRAALALAAHLSTDGTAGAGLSTTPGDSVKARAARVLQALEYLGEALVRAGVWLASKTGLGRLLEWRHRHHGEVMHLVATPSRFSPGMALTAPGGAP